MKIDPRYIEALRLLQRRAGERVYNESEARFLYLVAMHSGYFSQRQYLTFTKQTERTVASTLARKTLDKCHVKMTRYQGRGVVYHLFSGMVYRAIGQPKSINTRSHEFEFLQERLACLDYVLAHQDAEYLETSERKLEFFCQEMQLPIESIPRRDIHSRHLDVATKCYFLDRFPIFVARPDGPPGPPVTFTYMDAGHSGFTRYLTYLANYAPLFRQIGGFRLVFASAEPGRFEAASKHFSRIVLDHEGAHEGPSELMRYFRLRAAREAQDYAKLPMEDIHFYADAEKTFGTERHQRLYEKWRKGDAADAEVLGEGQRPSKPFQARFETYTLPSNRWLFHSSPMGKNKLDAEKAVEIQLPDDEAGKGTDG
jgi:hypothetical protein